MVLDANSAHFPASGLSYNGKKYPGTPFENKLVTGVRIPETMSLIIDNTATITAEVLPEDAITNDVYWDTSDDEVVAITGTTCGPETHIRANKEGTAFISAMSADGWIFAYCTVTVTNPCKNGHA